MKVVHIGYKYGLKNTGGAAIAATRLHRALLDVGVESHYVCVLKNEEGKNIHELPRRGCGCRCLFFLLAKLTRCVWKLSPYRRSIPLNIIPLFGLEKLLEEIKPDVVHIHWINADVMSFEQLARLKYKVVLNLHDLFMVNIIEPCPGNDMRYVEGVSRRNSSWLERWLFQRKQKAIHKCEAEFLGPSEWVCDCVRKSIIGCGLKVHVVSNIVSDQFRYNATLRIPHQSFIILYGCYGGRRNRFKGFADLEKALAFLPNEIKSRVELWIFGEEAEDTRTSGVTTRFLGEISDEESLVRVCHQSDILAFPSIHETQGMVKIEALLCGLPVVTFDRTACAEGIIHGQTGWVVADGDINSFADGILHYYELFNRNLIPHTSIAESTEKIAGKIRLIDDLMTIYRG